MPRPFPLPAYLDLDYNTILTKLCSAKVKVCGENPAITYLTSAYNDDYEMVRVDVPSYYWSCITIYYMGLPLVARDTYYHDVLRHKKVVADIPLEWWKRQWSKNVEEAIVAAAWHPRRFQEWCLDSSDAFLM